MLAGLASLAAFSPACAQDIPAPESGAIQDEVVIAPGEGGSVDGRLAVNIASGSGNQEVNDAVIAIGDLASAGSAVHQSISAAAEGDRVTRISLQGDAFSNISGLASINIAAGTQNQAANIAIVAIGNNGALTDQLLSQSRASINPSGSTGGTDIPNDQIEIGDDSFRDVSGLIQVNLIGGERNSSANTFVLNVLGEGSP
jgi:hypothetical protein